MKNSEPMILTPSGTGRPLAPIECPEQQTLYEGEGRYTNFSWKGGSEGNWVSQPVPSEAFVWFETAK
jgi:hypothetical protein